MKLRELRKEKHWSMKHLGEMVGCSESTISLYETGKREPSFETLLKFGEIFGVSVDYLLGNHPERSQITEPATAEDDELAQYLEELKTRPEMRMLFSITKGATKEDVERAVKIVEAALGK